MVPTNEKPTLASSGTPATSNCEPFINQSLIPESQKRNNNFGFLRLVFAALVLLAHSPELVDGNRSREVLTRLVGTMSFGELAVEGFFILSGYMIIKSWLQQPDLKEFLLKRVARIYPGFIAATLLSIFLFGLLGASDKATYLLNLSLSKCLFFATNLMAPPTPEVFKGTFYPIVNAPMWTLSYEFRCYLLVAVLGVAGVNNYRRIWLSIVLLTISLLVICSFFDIDKYHFPGSFYLFGVPSEILRMFSGFTIGACFYLYRDKIKYTSWGAAGAFLLLLGCLCYARFATAAFCTLGAYCIFYFSFQNIPALKIFQRLPDVSYGLYLYGWPVQKVLLWYFPTLSPWALFPLALVFSAGFGFISWKLVEAPALRMVSGYRRPAQVAIG